jgi:hypothetical protein
LANGVALDHAVLNFDRAAHRVDHAAELDETSVAGALHDAPMMGGDGRVDEVAAQAPQARQRAILVGAGKPTVADNICDQYCCELPGLAHSASSGGRKTSTMLGRILHTDPSSPEQRPFLAQPAPSAEVRFLALPAR